MAVFLSLVPLAAIFVAISGYGFDVKYIEVPLDHFSFTTNATFKLRYLFNSSYWHQDGPVFFYTGNEGDIEMFAQNTGFMWEAAPEFGALLVFAEHRYYGKSMPFGNNSFSSPQYSGYLSSAQALADYVWLIEDIKKCSRNKDVPVIAFGGSYGGMLAAWLRIKYPASIVGAIASSAPVLQFETPCHLYNDVVTKVYKISSRGDCTKAIKNSWKAIRQIGATDDGKSWITETWKLCQPLKDQDDLNNFVDWLAGIYGMVAMINYPYPTDFIAPVPAYPVKEICRRIQNDSTTGKPLIAEIQKAVSIYLNYTGQYKCTDLNSTSPSSKLDDDGWDYQACTEMVMPMCSSKSSMFEEESWNYTKFAKDCQQKWGVRAWRPDIAVLEYGGKNLHAASNIIFGNGLLDPWSPGGVLQNLSRSVRAVVMPEAAHHLDLRASNPKDPASVVEARGLYKAAIYGWIKEHRGC